MTCYMNILLVKLKSLLIELIIQGLVYKKLVSL